MTSDFGSLSQKDLISVNDLTTEDIHTIYRTAKILKKERGHHRHLLEGKQLGMIFEKDSLRTRFTFEVGMRDLGGGATFMDHRDARLGSRESIKDMARNLERWVHCLVARTFKHRAVEELAAQSQIPVINGLTDFLHPCQALTDFFTLTEKWGSVAGKRLCYVGDGNNTCHSLIYTAAKLGAHITVCSPQGYEPNARVVNEAMRSSAESGSEVVITNDPLEAATGADAVYTDVWSSMGQEDEIEERNGLFAEYQVNEKMMDSAGKSAFFLHCLPAHRGAEVTAAVMDGPDSIVYDNAENRLHVQKAIMTLLIGNNGGGTP